MFQRVRVHSLKTQRRSKKPDHPPKSLTLLKSHNDLEMMRMSLCAKQYTWMNT